MSVPAKPLQKPPGYRDPNLTAPKPKPPIRKPVLPSSYYNNKKRKRTSCCRICYCLACILSFVLVFALVLSLGLFYLWFDPKLPVFHLQSFKFQRFNVSVKSDGTYLNSLDSVRIEVKNTNEKMTLRYGGVEMRVIVGDGDGTELGTASLDGFTQGKTNVTSLRFVTRADDVLVGDGVGAKLKGQFGKRELVVFVEVKTKIGLGVGGWKIRMVGVNVLCGNVKLKQIDGGDMPKCTIRMLKWINMH